MKERLDLLLVKRGLAPSRERARTLIMAGEVYVSGQKEDKAGAAFAEDAPIEVRSQVLPYVSRGGLKLEKALQCFPVTPSGKVCLDAGASTGGFTDCMLQNGAKSVYAVDVGRGQLDWKLRNDPRVTCMEKTNVRYVTPADFPDTPGFVTADVSFISLTKILVPLRDIMSADGDMIVLVKPQFEAGREKVGKKGVVRDPAVHEEVIRNVISFAESVSLVPCGLDYSPIRGPEGNIEYLLWLRAQNLPDNSFEADIRGIVRRSHEELT